MATETTTMAEEKVEAPELELWLGVLAKAISNASPTSTVEGNNSHYVIPKADFNELGKTHRKMAKILYGNVSTAPNTRQRAERAARRMNELSLISTTLNTVEHRIQQVTDIIAAEFEK